MTQLARRSVAFIAVSRVPTTGAVVSNDIHSAIMARQGSKPQGIGYSDRKVLGARPRAIFIEVKCNFAELCKKKQDKQLDPRDKLHPAKPGTVGKSELQLANPVHTEHCAFTCDDTVPTALICAGAARAAVYTTPTCTQCHL